jgi:DNA-binding NarL/FixJ family response regulator
VTKDINVLVADDHELLREGLAQFLENCDGIHVIGTAGDGQEALDMCARLNPDVVVMDIRMPRMDGITATRLIRQQFADIRVVILASDPYDPDNENPYSAGASSILLKHVSINEISTALRKAVAEAPDKLPPQ